MCCGRLDADGKPQSRRPNGIVHHDAPLAWITAADATKRA
jgi:hypothetical protein